MTSNINPLNPTAVSATTESVRQNFAYAKQEIEALQVLTGGGQVAALMVPVTAGIPGTPASIVSGTVPMWVDSVNNRIYVYVSGALKYASLT